MKISSKLLYVLSGGLLACGFVMSAAPSVHEALAQGPEARKCRYPVKYLLTADYPAGRKAEYLEWTKTHAAGLDAPSDVMRRAIYENYYGVSPNRVVEYEFESAEAGARFFAKKETEAAFGERPDFAVNPRAHVLRLLSEYASGPPSGKCAYPVKYLFSTDYPAGRKAEYLEWANSVSADLTESSLLRRLASYVNHYGASPQRFVEFEFESTEDAARYFAGEKIRAIAEALPDFAANPQMRVLTLRSQSGK
ncbi:MAG: hypothetical protein OXL41_02315 [Nitrospinae bacterium]|nr:hypothetical protein [Nitrospinota bacterium]